jgi:hypothetical protein
MDLQGWKGAKYKQEITPDKEMSMANSSSFTRKLQVHRAFAEKTYQAE